MTPTAAPLFLAADVGGTRARFLLARWRDREVDQIFANSLEPR